LLHVGEAAIGVQARVAVSHAPAAVLTRLRAYARGEVIEPAGRWKDLGSHFRILRREAWGGRHWRGRPWRPSRPFPQAVVPCNEPPGRLHDHGRDRALTSELRPSPYASHRSSLQVRRAND